MGNDVRIVLVDQQAESDVRVTARDGSVVDTAAYVKRWAMGKPIDVVLHRYRMQRDTTVVELRIE